MLDWTRAPGCTRNCAQASQTRQRRRRQGTGTQPAQHSAITRRGTELELHAVESGRATAAGGCAVNGSAYDMSGCMIRHGSASYSMGLGPPPEYKIHRSNCLPFARLCLCDLLNRVLALRVLGPHQNAHYIKKLLEGGHNERQSAGGGGKEKKRNMEEREQKKKAKMRRTHTGNSVTANRTKLTNSGFFCAILIEVPVRYRERESQRARGALVEAAGSKRYEWTNQCASLKDDKPKNEQASRLFLLGAVERGAGKPMCQKRGKKEKDGGAQADDGDGDLVRTLAWESREPGRRQSRADP